METVLSVAHVIIILSLILIILAQKTNSDGLSSLAGGSNSGLFSGRAASNILTKMTYILAAIFMLNSLVLANLANKSVEKNSIINEIEVEEVQPKIPVAE